ncbi:MAG: DUF5696 domain-containing protein, partial [Acutalibacteraceae bacterium]
MKKRFLAIITALFCMANCLTVSFSAEESKKTVDGLGELVDAVEGTESEINFDYVNESEMLSKMRMISENENFRFMLNTDNLAFAVIDKKTGGCYTSNPYNAAKDPYYAGDIKKNINSQIILTYLDANIKKVSMWSADDCAAQGKYTVYIYENGVKIDMTFGEESDSTIFPLLFAKEKFEKILSQLDEDVKDMLEFAYDFYSKEDSKKIEEDFPGFKAQDVYYCSTELTNREKKTFGEAFESVKYDNEQYFKDLEKMGTNAEGEKTPNFKLSVYYTLTNEGIEVNIPNDSISYEGTYPLLDISVLPFFGADTEVDNGNGYLMIPDGSGAIINFDNSNDNRRRIISGRVYGEDGALMPTDDDNLSDSLQYYLPVYGIMRNNNTALFAIITGGEENAEISAYLGEPNSSYYSIRTKFYYTNYEYYRREPKIVRQNSASMMYMYDSNHTEADFKIQYYFLSGDSADYS